MEEWRAVVGHECYEVSNRGRVRSLDRYRPHNSGKDLFCPGQMLNPAKGDPYLRVALDNRVIRRVHRLVAAAFIGPCPVGMEVCHNNGDPLDNRIENLRYDTPSANEFDKVAHGRHHNANKTHCPHGHPYNAQNTHTYKGKRFCKACAAQRHERKSA